MGVGTQDVSAAGWGGQRWLPERGLWGGADLQQPLCGAGSPQVGLCLCSSSAHYYPRRLTGYQQAPGATGERGKMKRDFKRK